MEPPRTPRWCSKAAMSTKKQASVAYRRLNLPLLRNFQEIYGHLNVPQNFIVPTDKAWKSEFHGKKLGSYFNNIRTLLKKGDVFVREDIEEAEKLGLVLKPKFETSKF